MEILVGQNNTGLDLYRELDYFIGGIREPKITIFYYEWLKSPNGTKIQSSILHKRYVVIDIPAVVNPGEMELVSEEVGHTEPEVNHLDEDGVTIIIDTPEHYVIDIPAVYQQGEDVIVSPASLAYTAWKEKIITQEMIGAKLGDDIIIGSINSTLSGMPIEAPDNYAVTI